MNDHIEFIIRFLLFAGAHSLFASGKIKALFKRSGEGEPRFYRLGYNLASLAAFGWVMAAYRHTPLLYEIHGALSWLMRGAQVAAGFGLLACVRQTGTGDFLGTDQALHGPATGRHLVTTGCYAHVRHPLYFLSMLILTLTPVMSLQWALLTLLSLAYFITGGLIEEQRLLQQFGEEYQAYRKRVPFLIPSPIRRI